MSLLTKYIILHYCLYENKFFYDFIVYYILYFIPREFEFKFKILTNCDK